VVRVPESELYCWKCGETLADILLPFPRLAKCSNCRADLHVCRMCTFYDTTVSNSCREPVAETVNDKTRANFCGYFQPGSALQEDRSGEIDANRATLEDLFGMEKGSAGAGDAGQSKQELDSLFGLDDDKPDQGGTG